MQAGVAAREPRPQDIRWGLAAPLGLADAAELWSAVHPPRQGAGAAPKGRNRTSGISGVIALLSTTPGVKADG